MDRETWVHSNVASYQILFKWYLIPPCLLFPQRLSRYVLRPSSGVCRNRESSRNFELRSLFNPCSDSVGHNRVQVLRNGIRTGDPRGFNKGRSSKFREGSLVQQTPEKGRWIYRLKRCRNNNKDEDNCPNTFNDKNHQALSQKFR